MCVCVPYSNKLVLGGMQEIVRIYNCFGLGVYATFVCIVDGGQPSQSLPSGHV